MGKHNKLEYKKQEYINKKYGRLTVVKFIGYNKFKQSLWLFRCECGTEKELLLSPVKRGVIKSCGCITQDGVGAGNASFNEVYNTYKHRAYKKSIPFELSKYAFKDMTQRVCFYCGSYPNNKCSKSVNGDYVYNGLDRLDSSKGYTLDNIVPCCKKCNEAKMDSSLLDFYNWVQTVCEHIPEDFIKKGIKNA